MRRYIKITKKEFEAAKNQALTDGYNLGFQDGLTAGLYKRVTPNDLRALIGLPPMEEGKVEK